MNSFVRVLLFLLFAFIFTLTVSAIPPISDAINVWLSGLPQEHVRAESLKYLGIMTGAFFGSMCLGAVAGFQDPGDRV